MKRILLILFLYSISPYTFAGWEIVTKYYNNYNDPQNPRLEHVFISNGFMKIESGTISTIFNIKKQEITYYNTSNKRFWHGSYIKFNEDVKAETIRMIDQEVLKSNKDQQEKLREMYNEMFKTSFIDNQSNQTTKSFTIKKLNKEQVIAGYKSFAYQVVEVVMPLEVIWIAGDLKISQDFDFRGFSSLMEKLVKGEYGSSFENSNQYFKLLDEGYPMKVEMKNQDGTTNISEVIKVNQMNLNDSDFRVPQGYILGSLTDVGVWDAFK